MPKLQAFDKNENKKTKRIMIGIPMALVVIAVVIVASSYAIFQQQLEAALIKATVGDFDKGDIKLAITVNGKEVDSIPDKGNYFVEVDCGSDATGSWNNEKWGAEITKIKSKKVSCTVNFEKIPQLWEEVAVGTEHFYIIGIGDATLTLLSKYALNPGPLLQSSGLSAVVFSASTYWTCPTTYQGRCVENDGKNTPYNLNGIDNSVATAVNFAKKYGEKLGGTGRLMTYEEATELKASNGDLLYKAGDGATIKYWLGSAAYATQVYAVNMESSWGFDTPTCNTAKTYGVRPVIEISKDKITSVVN